MSEDEGKPSQEPRPKKSRHRKKHLYNTILNQMDFYFSDSNIAKDRFLAQLLSENSNIDVQVFLKFNKIKKLNCTVEDIQKAIKKSEVIGITEDGQKLFRKKPVEVKENVDFCTIYVENIKADASHESLSQIFSDFGNVVYVSIPKYKHTRANKGFAFIEYETEEQAAKAIAFFDSIGCKIPSEKSPDELQSIVTFQQEQEAIDSEEKIKIKLEQDEEQTSKRIKSYKEETVTVKTEIFESKVKVEQDNEIKNQETKKRKLSVNEKQTIKKEKSDEEKVPVKTETFEGEVKVGHDNKIREKQETKKRKLSVDEEQTKNKKQKSGEEKISQEKTEINKAQTEDAKKKKKNKKEKRKIFIKELGMKVLSKKEWKKLRNRYLDLQRQKMRLFKQYLYGQKYGPKPDLEYEMEETSELPQEVEEKPNKLTYMPGVIVKLHLPEPCMDVKKLKNEIKAICSEVQYVDIPLPAGSEEVFIRFSSKEAASEFCTNEFSGEKTIIEGDEEKDYWEKIDTDRAVKFKKMAKKQRGRDKLLKKAEKESLKHLRFEEDD